MYLVPCVEGRGFAGLGCMLEEDHGTVGCCCNLCCFYFRFGDGNVGLCGCCADPPGPCLGCSGFLLSALH